MEKLEGTILNDYNKAFKTSELNKHSLMLTKCDNIQAWL